MKIFIDTNVLIAAFISHGSCMELLDHCMTSHQVFTSDFVIQELAATLHRKFKYPPDEITQAKKVVLSGAAVSAEAHLAKPLSRDPDDDHVIAAALQAKVHCIISGDNDLKDLKQVFNIPIIAPRDFWKFEEDFKARHNS